MYRISGPTGTIKAIRNLFIIIFIGIEILGFAAGISTNNFSFFNMTYVIFQFIWITLVLGIYFISKKILSITGELKDDAYTLVIYSDKIEIKEPNKEKIVIYANDIEAVKYGRITNSIFFRFKDFSKYAKEYDLNEYQISLLQKRKYYWVGNKLPYLSKEEREKFKKALEKFKKVNRIV